MSMLNIKQAQSYASKPMSMMSLPYISVHSLNDNYDITQNRSFIIPTETGL